MTVEVRSAVDCVRVAASDERTGSPASAKLPVNVVPGEVRVLVVAVLRRLEWGERVRLQAEGRKGDCAGLLVLRSATELTAFGGGGRVPNVTLVLEGQDEDRDGHVARLPGGAAYDCDDLKAEVHPGAAEPCASVDLDCDGRAGCERSECLGQRDVAGRRCCPGGVAPDLEPKCDDGLDQDCDGLADCADGDCAGQLCDAFGRRCLGPASCDCPGGAAMEVDCGDGRDGDCDGLADCADPDCGGRSCGPAGRCTGATCCSVGPDGGVAVGPERCGDSLDNDCNQAADCADPACGGKPFDAGLLCCGATGSPAPVAEASCADGADDDCDGLSDCDDPSCERKPCVTSDGGGACWASACRGESCKNRVDDNGDGKIDCADTLCLGVACNDFGAVCGSSGSCECNGSAVAVESGASCANGTDDDCDGKADCLDSSCAGQACGPSKVCQGAACICAMGQPSEVSCADKADNDCDGQVDCADADCGGRACSPSGGACQGGACVCQLSAEADCKNGADDDCNGAADCADLACAQKACGPFGRTCDAGVCSCPTGAVEPCANGVDDNCDGLVDCQDSQRCPPGTVCSTAGQKRCVGASCSCPLGQAAETSCGDGLDNDCDGQTDCVDADCGGLACSVTGRRCAGGACVCPLVAERCDLPGDEDCDGQADCSDAVSCPAGSLCGAAGLRCSDAGVCSCPSGQARELTCADGADNDCDGAVDCADPDCLGAACGSGQSFCCGAGCAVTAAQGNCGYCSFTCVAGEACQATPSGAVDCTCASDTDCLPSHRCKNFGGTKLCVECLSSADCPSARPACSAAGVCYCPPAVPCTPVCVPDGGGCAGGTPLCAPSLGRCVECLSPSHCDGGPCVNFFCQ